MASCILLNLKEKKLIQLEMWRILMPRGVLGSVWSVLYVYGQPKPNISVCEILNQNRLKWLEIVSFDGISVLVGFGRVSIFQRQGH